MPLFAISLSLSARYVNLHGFKTFCRKILIKCTVKLFYKILEMPSYVIINSTAFKYLIRGFDITTTYFVDDEAMRKKIEISTD